MAKTTKIQWADATWNPFIGCTKVSPACDNCYAEGWAKRCGRDFSKVVRAATGTFHAPLTWKEPKRIFVCSLSDFFHADILRADRHDAIRTMRHAPQHTYLLLTKRPENIKPMLAGTSWALGLPDNVWLGVTVENQEQANKRIPLLLQVPARVLFVSCEPLLGPVDLTWWMGGQVCRVHLRSEFETCMSSIHRAEDFGSGLDWVIAGGESGPHARPMHPSWPRALRDQCAASVVPFMFKQWGEYAPPDQCEPGLEFLEYAQSVGPVQGAGGTVIDYSPARYGKANTGRLLDGVEHNGVPA